MRAHMVRFFVVLMLMASAAAPSLAASPTLADITARAQQGEAKAQYELGRMYQGGRGVPQSAAEAAQWYRRSAEQGYPPAERDLGSMYLGGYGGLPKDDVEARRWLHKAADQGDGLAKFGLFLDELPLVHAIRGLPQRERDWVFFAVLTMIALIALAAIVFCIFVLWKLLKRIARP